MSVEFPPTCEMTGYLLTKPNQGWVFKIFRDLIMGGIPQTDPSNINKLNGKKNKTKKKKKE